MKALTESVETKASFSNAVKGSVVYLLQEYKKITTMTALWLLLSVLVTATVVSCCKLLTEGLEL